MKPLLSICIPTYNRSSLLKECLASLTQQFADKKVYRKTEIVISDNNSPDDTQKLTQSFQKKYKNIVYHERSKTVQADYNIIHAASFATGLYRWFFSDDDLHYPDSLSTIVKIIENHHPDAIICNLDLCSKDGRKIIDRNLLRLKEDIIIKTKKELFSFLESKFFIPLDWYCTCISNTIVSEKIYQDNLKQVMKLYNPHSNNFLHSGLIYYKPDDYQLYIISQSLARFRTDNRSFGPTDKFEFLRFWHPTLNKHYENIVKVNKKNISFKFICLLELKKLTRNLRLLLLRLLNMDIATILMKLFYKNQQ